MKPRLVMVIVVALGVSGVWGLNLGCSHEAKPVVQPDEHPPLPPASGTMIGLLVDDASELKLNDDQITKLKAISDQLGAQLATDDAGLRPTVATAPSSEGQQRGLGFRASGSRTDDGTYGGNEAFPNAPTGNPSGATSGQYYIPADTVNAAHRDRARHLRDAIRKALALLDADQQAIAKRVFTEHGVNLDTGEVAGGDPGNAPMEEPKLGQPLPREQ